MILGFLSDAHGNDAGLDRCVEALRRANASELYFLGDAVGYMPNGDRVLSRLRDIGAHCIRGNHEEMLLGNISLTPSQDSVYRLELARSRLRPDWIEWIQQWPIERTVAVEGASLLLVHGSPSDPLTGYVYPDTDLSPFDGLPHDVVMIGHTHRPFVRRAGRTTIVNVGSCGLPRDIGNLASCATYDTEQSTADIVRVEFDALSLIAEFGDRIDTSVVACLQRTGTERAVGQRIDA